MWRCLHGIWWCLETSGTEYSVTEPRIPEELVSHFYIWVDNLKGSDNLKRGEQRMDTIVYVNHEDGLKKKFWSLLTHRENKPGVGIKYPNCKWLILVSYYIIPGVDSTSNRNEHQEYFLGVKAVGA